MLGSAAFFCVVWIITFNAPYILKWCVYEIFIEKFVFLEFRFPVLIH